MHVTERKPRSVGAGIGWLVLGVLMAFGLFISLFLGPLAIMGFLFFGLGLCASGVKAWSAFTGARRVGSADAAETPVPAPR